MNEFERKWMNVKENEWMWKKMIDLLKKRSYYWDKEVM